MRKSFLLVLPAALVVLASVSSARDIPLVLGARVITLDGGLEQTWVRIIGHGPYDSDYLHAYGDLRLPELILGTRFTRRFGVAVAGALGSGTNAPTVGSDQPSLGLYLFHASPLRYDAFNRVVYGRIRGWNHLHGDWYDPHGDEGIRWRQVSLGLSLSRFVFEFGAELSYNYASIGFEDLSARYDGWQVGIRIGVGAWHEFRL